MAKRIVKATAGPDGEARYEAGFVPDAGEEAAAAALPNEVLAADAETLPAVDLAAGPVDIIAEADEEAAAALAAIRAGETPGQDHAGVDYMERPDLIPTDQQVGLALELAAINAPAAGEARPVRRIGPPPDGGEAPKRPFDFAAYEDLFDRAAPLELLKTAGKLFFIDGGGNIYYLDEVHSGEFTLRLRMYAPPAE